MQVNMDDYFLPRTTGVFVPFGHTIVGTCGKCSGPVTVPTIWGAVIPPRAQCARCGAVEKHYKEPDFGPVMDME